MTKKSEAAVIDFTKFSIAQLPELNGKKEEIKAIIEANPVIEVTDNASYELAKKSRTAVKTLRTGLEKEKKDVNDRIKNNVLLVVANEYDSLITGVKNDENARQEHVTAWEEKKEAERLEKVRLEQERVDNIKKSIQEFANHWNTKISLLKFDELDSFETELGEAFVNFDRGNLAEYEVLLDDQKTSIYAFFETKANQLERSEEIRLEQIALAEERERQRIENEKIAETQRIEREKFEAEQKAIAEKQRIAQEKFLAEKKEFEEKQLKAKIESRIKQLTDLGLVYDEANLGYKIPEVDGHLFFDWQISGFDDNNFDASFDWYKEQIAQLKNGLLQEVEFEETKTDEFANENYHEEDVHEIAKPKEELTWESIENNFLTFYDTKHELVTCHDAFEWLSENYEVPQPKN